MRTVKITPDKNLSKYNDKRYSVYDAETNVLLDDGQGYGYKSWSNALKAFVFKAFESFKVSSPFCTSDNPKETKKNVVIIKVDEKLSTRGHIRYSAYDDETGKLISNAHGNGYRSWQSALKACAHNAYTNFKIINRLGIEITIMEHAKE